MPEVLEVSRELWEIDPALAERLSDDLSFANRKDIGDKTYVNVVEELAKYLYACSQTPGVTLSPSPIIDQAWHELILNTQDYAKHCEKLGAFVHHVRSQRGERSDPANMWNSVHVIDALGLRANIEAWDGTLNDASNFMGCGGRSSRKQ